MGLFEVESHLCVFCLNKDVNAFEDHNNFWTSRKCLHEICETCRDKIFATKRDPPCKACGKPFRKGDLSERSREEIEFETERQVRSSITREFNKTKDDYGGDANLFEDYKEMVESILYIKLNENVQDESDVAMVNWANQQITMNRKQNATNIAENKARKANEERQVEESRAKRLQDLLNAQRKRAERERQKHERKEQAKREASMVAIGEMSKNATAAAKAYAKAEAIGNDGLPVTFREHHGPGAPAYGGERNDGPQPSLLQYGAGANSQAAAAAAAAPAVPFAQPARMEDEPNPTRELPENKQKKLRRMAAGFTMDPNRNRVIEAMEDGLLMGVVVPPPSDDLLVDGAGLSSASSVKMEVDA